MFNSLVSLIIPVYNREYFLNECLISIYKQTYRPIEVIVVDDGSSDKSINIALNFKKQFSSEIFFVEIIKQKNQGANYARNNGFKNSKGEYIQFLDSDDLLLPNKIKNQISELNNGFDIVYSKAQFFRDDIGLIIKFWGREFNARSSDFFEFPWQTMCAIYRKDIIKKYGLWREDLNLNDDWEFSLRYVLNCYKQIFFLNEVSSLYRDHDNDRIGRGFTPQKMDSFINSLETIFLTSLKTNRINNYLRFRYLKRYTYCFIQCRKLGHTKGQQQIIKNVKKINTLYSIFLRLFTHKK